METPDESAQAGSIERQFVADMVFWLAQTKDERLDEIIRIISSKNRNGKTGWTISLDTNYSYMTFYRAQPEVRDEADDRSPGSSEEMERDAGEERETVDVPEEKRDLQRLYLDSQKEQSVVQKCFDGEDHVPDMSASDEHERGEPDHSEGGDTMPEVSVD
jgi:hypothetical protein